MMIGLNGTVLRKTEINFEHCFSSQLRALRTSEERTSIFVKAVTIWIWHWATLEKLLVKPLVLKLNISGVKSNFKC